MGTRYKVSLYDDGGAAKCVGFVNLSPLDEGSVDPSAKHVLRDDGSVIKGDKHTCNEEKKPKKDEELHLKHFGDERCVELKGHAKYEEDNSRFFHKEPKSKDDKVGTIGRDDWEALDAGGPSLDKKVLTATADSKPFRVQTKGNSWAMIILADEPKNGSRKLVYLSEKGEKKELIATAWHTCKNPRKPEFLEMLSAEGLVTGSGNSFKGPAHFIPQDISTHGSGFFYRKNSEDSPGGVAQDDWEALDAGGSPPPAL